MFFDKANTTRQRLRRLEAVSLAASIIVLVSTYLAVGHAHVQEVNPLIGAAIGTIPWPVLGAGKLLAVVAAFASIRRLAEIGYPRIALGVGAGTTLLIGANAINDLIVLLQTGLSEVPPFEFAVLTLILVVISAVAYYRSKAVNIVLEFGVLSKGPHKGNVNKRVRQVVTLMFATLVIISSIPAVVPIVSADSSPTAEDISAYVAEGNKIHLVDASTNETLWTFTGHTNTVNEVTNSDGYVYSASSDGTIRKINRNGNEVWSYNTGDKLHEITVSDDGSFVVVGSSTTDTLYQLSKKGVLENNRSVSYGVMDMDIWNSDIFVTGGTVGRYSSNDLSEIQSYTSGTYETISVEDGYIWAPDVGGSGEVRKINVSDGTIAAKSSFSKYGEETDVFDSSDPTNKAVFGANGNELWIHAKDTLSRVKRDASGFREGTSSENIGDVDVVHGTSYALVTDTDSVALWDMSGSSPSTIHSFGTAANSVAYASSNPTTSISGRVVSCPVTNPACDTPSGVPVSNATVVGYASLQPDLSTARSQLQSLSNPTPSLWEQQGGASVDLLGEGGAFSTADQYVATHTQDALPKTAPWLDAPNLRSPKLVLPANEEIILSAWDGSASGIGTNRCIPGVGSEYDCQLPGAHMEEATIMVERIGPGGDVIGEPDEFQLNQTSGGGFADPDRFKYTTVTFEDPGYYRMYVKGSSNKGPIRQVGKPSAIMDQYRQDAKDQLSEHAQNIKTALQENTVKRIVTTADANGHYTLNVPANAKLVHVQAYKAPGILKEYDTKPKDVTLDTIRSKYNAALTTDEEKLTARMKRLRNTSVYFPSRIKTAEPPASDVDITLYELSAPPGSNLSAMQDRLAQLEDLLMNGSLSDLPPALQQRLEELNREQLEDVYSNLDRLRERNDALNERYRKLAEEVGIDPDQRLNLNPDEASDEELRQRIQALQQAMTEMQESIESGEGTVDVGEETLTYRQMFDSALQPEDVVVVAHWANGTSQVVPDEYISVDRSLSNVAGVGSSAVVVEDFPIGSADPAAVTFETRVANSDGVGNARQSARNPTFDGTIPSLDSAVLSSLHPGPNDNVEVRLNPAEESSFRNLTSVKGYGPGGQTLSVGNISGRSFTFTTNGEGVHVLRMTLTDLDGNQYVETLRVKTGETDMNRLASIRAKESVLGTYAVVGDGLDGGDMEITTDGPEFTARIGQDADVPNEIHVYSEGLTTNAASSTTVRVVRGEAGESVKSHTRVVLHTPSLTENAIVYRNGNQPITTDAATRYGRVTKRADGTTIQTYTDASGEVSVRTINAPGVIDRALYWARTQISGLDLPITEVIS